MGISHGAIRETTMKRFVQAAVTVALALIVVSLLPVAQAADVEHVLVHQQRLRSYVLHVPETGDATRSNLGADWPLVMVLHGGGGNAETAARMSGMSTIADREGFVVVYPNGSGRLRRALLTWNAGNCCGKALEDQVDDVGFLNAVIDHVARRYRVNKSRVYLTGMSNGGMMTYRMGCETPERFAAIAPVAGAMNLDCKPTAPLSVIAFHGRADGHVRYEGGAPKKTVDHHPRVDTPVRQTVTFWNDFNACKTYVTETVAEVTTEIMGNCAAGTEVELNTLEAFGHAWPGGARGSARGDDPSASIQASEVMWEFFDRHTR
jgi:polyhydroxybutyrate depolymerase